MDLATYFIILLFILICIVLYQSRKDQPNIRTYFSRLKHLIVLILFFFKEIGFCISTKFKEIDWNLTTTSVQTGAIESTK
jgi:hypothetical protein